MSAIREVTIPVAKPAFELIDDRLSQKVTPRYSHARLQSELTSLLGAWAQGRGRVGTEWRFYLDVPEPGKTSLVPDVAYLSFERLSRDQREAAEEPRMAPEVAVEILSPSDWQSQVDCKTELYLAAGTALVLEVDSIKRTVRIHDRLDHRVCREGDVVEHPALPGFRLDVAELFAAIE